MLTGINTVNSNQENNESYLHGYKNGYDYAKVKLIEDACDWLEQHHEDYYQYDAWGGECVNLTTLIQDFKKAMGSDETSTL